MKLEHVVVTLAALSFGLSMPGRPVAQLNQDEGGRMTQTQSAGSASHDFDFLIGRWRVHHRRLKERLAKSHEWIEFEGTSAVQKVMGGSAMVDDNALDFPDGAYRAAGLRAFDAKSGQWSIWWLDSRMPLGPLDPPLRGRFRDAVGTFYSDETFNGMPIRVRFTWSAITATTCHWEQAFSADGGASWETNWLMDFERES
ncbi:MAG TPA: DUF1579 domain-containing protein [Casimicrobiaceae bacterium]|nr:DUF1579 domain-containing protein [Casimicrobiaceae bacterium]